MGPRIAARAPMRGASLPAMEAAACTSSGWRSRAPQNRNDVTVRAPKPFVFSNENSKPYHRYGLRRAECDRSLPVAARIGVASIGAATVRERFLCHPYTLNADPVLAKASTLSSNSKPAVRGLWLRTYHL